MKRARETAEKRLFEHYIFTNTVTLAINSSEAPHLACFLSALLVSEGSIYQPVSFILIGLIISCFNIHVFQNET